MTQREEFEKWLNTLDKQTLVTMAAKQAKTIKLMQTAKATSFTLPDRMDYELHGDNVISDTFADGYNQCLSDVISMNEEYANSTVSDGWIPVSERLPPSETPIDVYVEIAGGYSMGDSERVADCFYDESKGNFWMWDGKKKNRIYFNGVYVTHWMHRPEAPGVNK